MEILLRCARTRLSETQARELRALASGPVQWEDLSRLGREHGLEPLLYWHLRGEAASAVPPPVMQQLRGEFEMHVIENLRLVAELTRLLRDLDREGLRAIPWKGCALGLSVYGNMAMRKAGDLDLLIAPGDFRRAQDLLLSLGYRITTPRRPDGRPADWDCYEFRFVRSDGLVTVELPWRVPPRSRYFAAALDFDDLWERRETIAGSGRGIPGLPVEEMLVCLCVHGARHQWDRLMWVCDIAEIVRARPDLDWERVGRQARALGNQRILALGLLLAARLLEAGVPREALQAAGEDRVVCEFAARIEQHHRAGLAGARGNRGPFEESDHRGLRRYEYLMAERWQDRTRWVLEQIAQHIPPNERDRAWISLPDRLDILYYILRPVRLLTVIGAGATRRLSRQRSGEVFRQV